MRLSRFLAVTFLGLTSTMQLSAQWTEAEVDGVSVKGISPQMVRLSWTAVPPEKCGDSITYSIFRDTKEDFDPTEENQIAIGIPVTHFVAHEPKGPKDFYYRVTAVRVPGRCVPPSLKSGVIRTFPLDLGGQYSVSVGDKTEECKATSTAELACPTLSYFHAVIASQSEHEFLIGCLSSDYENDNWTCINLKLGAYNIFVHSLTATILNAGASKVNTETGKNLGPIIPEFSVLAVLH